MPIHSSRRALTRDPQPVMFPQSLLLLTAQRPHAFSNPQRTNLQLQANPAGHQDERCRPLENPSCHQVGAKLVTNIFKPEAQSQARQSHLFGHQVLGDFDGCGGRCGGFQSWEAGEECTGQRVETRFSQ